MSSVQMFAFFDIGQTLGVPHLRPDFRLSSLDVYPYIPNILSKLQEEGVRLGIISNTGNETRNDLKRVLTNSGIYRFFEDFPELLIYSSEVGLLKNSPEIFSIAAVKAGFRDEPERCVYVGEDSAERYFAKQAGFKPAPHPNLTLEVIRGESLRYIRFTARGSTGRGWRTGLIGLPLVPLNVEGRSETRVLAITSSRTSCRLDDLGFEVDRLGIEDLPVSTELYLIRDDRQTRTGFMNPAGQSTKFFGSGKSSEWVLTSGKEGLVIALPALRSIEEVHFDEAGHGHNSKFLPDLGLLTPFGLGEAYRQATWISAKDGWLDQPEIEPTLPEPVIAALTSITEEVVKAYVDRYIGLTPLFPHEDGEARSLITSRHIHSDDNFRAVKSLLKEFEGLSRFGLTSQALPFTHEGRVYYNVEAVLPGSKVVDGLPDLSHEIVIVSAHLDSTAAFSDHPYNPSSDPAPGADDDASGIAAVLALAKVFAELPNDYRPYRTIKFLLFNAEEHGLVGSRAYARDQAALNVGVVAVFQMDMIGYIGENDELPRPYEIHSGYPDDADVEQRSIVLAKRLRRLASLVATRSDGELGLREGQLYVASDPAANRSDHASFHERGYAACVISEDFFLGPDPSSPAPQGNEHYHKDSDREVASDYLADIARAVGAAAYVTAILSSGAAARPTSFGVKTMESKIDARTKVYERISKQHAYADKLRGTLQNFQHSAKVLPDSLTGGGKAQVAGVNPITLTLKSFSSPKQFLGAASTNRINDALQFVNQVSAASGFGGSVKPEFFPDPVIPPTSSGTAVVNLLQHYKGVPIFQMTRTVRFGPQKTDMVGNHVQLETNDFSILPKLSAIEACLVAAKKVAETHANAAPPNHWSKDDNVRPVNLEIESYKPSIEVAFGLPAQPVVLSQGRFAHQVPASLVMFYLGKDEAGADQMRLGWQLLFTLPEAQGQYRAIVSADSETPEILYLSEISRSTAKSIPASDASVSATSAPVTKARVYKTSGRATRADVVFPLSLNEYPIDLTAINLPSTFPYNWNAVNACQGPSTQAVRGYTSDTYSVLPLPGAGNVEFFPTDGIGNDQKVLNIFYFCCYMHDFFYMLGFDEASGNFSGTDPVVARAHPGSVWGIANMATYPDGQKPEMNMGLVTSTNRHTAFDADVVFHEFVHGVTNRLVGGRMNTSALEEVQSGGMGEGWGDYFALTIQNFGQPTERVVTGDWVFGNTTGIRNFPYDDQFPLNFGDLGETVRGVDLTEVHNIGEVWCACLMHLHRKLAEAIGGSSEDLKRANQLGWQIVVDSLKLMPVNPSFLDARDSILQAARDMNAAGRFDSSYLAGKFSTCFGAIWMAFAGFGMGANASSLGASVFGVVGDDTIPNDTDVPADLRGTTVARGGGTPSSLTPYGFGNTAPAELKKLIESWDELTETARAMINGIVAGATSR